MLRSQISGTPFVLSSTLGFVGRLARLCRPAVTRATCGLNPRLVLCAQCGAGWDRSTGQVLPRAMNCLRSSWTGSWLWARLTTDRSSRHNRRPTLRAFERSVMFSRKRRPSRKGDNAARSRGLRGGMRSQPRSSDSIGAQRRWG